MKKAFIKTILAAVAMAALCAVSAQSAETCSFDAAQSLKFHADAQYIRDNYGRVAMFRGANLGTCYYKDGIGFGDENLEGLRSYGFNFIRLNLGWNFLEPNKGEYDRERMKKIVAFIDRAQEFGIYTMPDFHQMLWEAHIPWWMRDESMGHGNLSEMSPQAAAQSSRFWEKQELQDDLIGFIVYQAKNFKDVDGLFGYDLFNEPFSVRGTSYGDFEKCCLFPFYKKAIAAVRAVDPNAPIILEPQPQGAILPFYAKPFDDGNIVYSPHSYFPHSYGPNGLIINREEGPVDVRMKYARFKREADDMHVPWLIGEYGGDPATYAFTKPWLEENMTMQDKYFVGSAIWSFAAKGGGGWNINSDAKTLHPHFEEIIVRPYPQYTAGTPDKMKYDKASETFHYRFNSDPNICAPTEIYYPKELFKRSQVAIKSECDVPWSYDEANGVLKLAPGCDGVVEIKVAPVEN